MTTKQIADAVNRPERTVQRWAKQTGAKIASIGAKLAAVANTGKPADWDLAEAVAIIELGLGKNAASLFRESAARTLPTPSDARIDRLEGMVEKLLGAVAALVPAVQGPVASSAHAALPAPLDLQPRDALRKLVDGYARTQGGGPAYQAAWSELYREYGYRYHRDIVRAAKNRGQSVLDYADAEDIIGQLYLLAAQLYGRKEGAA
jgi:hypothetical protein